MKLRLAIVLCALFVATFFVASTRASEAEAFMGVYYSMSDDMRADIVSVILSEEFGVSSDAEKFKLGKALKKIGKGVSKVGKAAIKVVKQNAIPIAIGVATGGIGGVAVGIAKAEAGKLAAKGLNKITKGKLGKFAPIIQAGIGAVTGGGNLKDAGKAVLDAGKQMAADKAKEKLNKITKGKLSPIIDAGVSGLTNGGLKGGKSAVIDAAKQMAIDKAKEKLNKATKGKLSPIIDAGVDGVATGGLKGGKTAVIDAAKQMAINKAKEKLNKATKGKLSPIIDAGIDGVVSGGVNGGKDAVIDAAKQMAIEKAKEALNKATKGKLGQIIDGLVQSDEWDNFLLMAADMVEEEETMADQEAESEAPSVYCLQSGLNYRSSPCGALAGTTSSSVQARSLNNRQVVSGCQYGSSLEWLNVQLPSGSSVWVANLPNLISDCSPAAPGSGISVDQLRAVMPNLPTSTANAYISHLNNAMSWGSITNCPRRSAFLAQLAHESVELRYMEEIASGAAYEGRRDLGNIYPGDGVRYKGRGPIQLTGRANYRTAGAALGVDLENNPTLAATPQWGFKIAAWFWNSRNLNSYADQNTQSGFDSITYRVNGGYNGKASRDAYWRKAKSVLGC